MKLPQIKNLLILIILFVFILKTPAFASFTKYYQNPVFGVNIVGNWDDKNVSTPNIIYDNGIYKLWYDGNSGVGTSGFGYATSPDGIIWSRFSNNSIFLKDNSDTSEYEIASPKVIKYENEYRMWYLSTSSLTSSGSEVFRIKYATSPNGIDSWTRYGYVFRRSGATWEAEGVIPCSIIYKDGEFKLWYGARDSSGWWRIGYARSTNGTEWTRNVNPVLEPTLLSDGNNVNAGSVFFNEISQKYEMYFHAGTSPIYIWHAVSENGEDWIRDLLPTLEIDSSTIAFDHIMIAAPSVLYLNNTTLLYYAGNNENMWRIGLATDNPFPVPTPSVNPTPSPIPSPTPSPIPIPSPTPIPTPLPTPSTTKIVIVPGITASWNFDALVHCKPDNYQGNWQMLPPPAPQVYQTLYDTLINQGYQVFPYYYDWRKNVTDNGIKLKNFIDSHTTNNEKIHLIGHSMGGLISRAYIEQTGYQNKVDKFLSVGSPHQGALSAYFAWEGGEIKGSDLIWKIYNSLLIFSCQIKDGSNNPVAMIHKYVPSIQNTLPIFDYLIDKNTGAFKPVQNMHEQNNWLSYGIKPNLYNVYSGTFSGYDQDTIEKIVVRPRNQREAERGLWIDGVPQQDLMTKDGDETVLLKSSEFETVEQLRLNTQHTNLVNTSNGINLISDFFGGIQAFKSLILDDTQLEEITKMPKSALVFVADPEMFWMISLQNKSIKSNEGITIIFDPKPKDYLIFFIPKKRSSKLLVGVFLKNGKYHWKEYKFSGFLPKFKKFHFDRDNLEANKFTN